METKKFTEHIGGGEPREELAEKIKQIAKEAADIKDKLEKTRVFRRSEETKELTKKHGLLMEEQRQLLRELAGLRDLQLKEEEEN